MKKVKPISKLWCNLCHKKVKLTMNRCSICGTHDLATIKKKFDVKFYFLKMEGWYLLPTVTCGRLRLPEDVGANTFEITFVFLCFEICIEFWWNIADVLRIESVEDILEVAIEVEKLKEKRE